MLKQPRAGRVKTRLARDIGPIPAAWWFRHQTSALLRRLARDPRWQTVLSLTPDRAIPDPRWPQGLAHMAQGRGDLGQRMARAFNMLPPGPAVLIGGDIPGVRPQHIKRAFAALGGAEACFGPAEDGGFWLVGFRRRQPLPRHLFQAVRWSGPHALADSLQTMPGTRVALVNRLRDVDGQKDL